MTVCRVREATNKWMIVAEACETGNALSESCERSKLTLSRTWLESFWLGKQELAMMRKNFGIGRRYCW